MGSLITKQKGLLKELNQLGFEIYEHWSNATLASSEIHPTLINMIKTTQKIDVQILTIKNKTRKGSETKFLIKEEDLFGTKLAYVYLLIVISIKRFS